MTDTLLFDPAWIKTDPPQQDDGGDDGEPDGFLVCAHITDPQGATYGSSCHLPADINLAQLAAASLQVLRAMTMAHSTMLPVLLADLIGREGVPPDPRSGGLTVSLVDQVVEQHRTQHGHAPDRMEIPNPDGPPYQLHIPILRAVLAAANAW